MADSAAVYFALCGLLVESSGVSESELVGIFRLVLVLREKWNCSDVSSVSLLQILAVKSSLVTVPLLSLVDILSHFSSGVKSDLFFDPLLRCNDWGEVALQLGQRLPLNSRALFDRSTPLVREQVARELMLAVSAKSTGLGWTCISETDSDQLLFSFCKVYAGRVSENARDVRVCQPLFDLVGDYEPFKSWFKGIVEPHAYYREVCDSIVDDCASLRLFDALPSVEDQVALVLKPWGTYSSSNISIDRWFTRVLLPLTKYHRSGVGPILQWMDSQAAEMQLADIFTFWHKCVAILVLVGTPETSDLGEVLRHFLATAYFYSFKYDAKSSSVAILSSYDLMRATLGFFEGQDAVPDGLHESLSHINLDSFYDFLQHNPLAIHPNAASVRYLRSVVDSCARLYPINKITISGYFQLKSSDVSSEREVGKILAGLNLSNCPQLLASVDSFVGTFIGLQTQDVNRAVLERLLVANLFDEAKTFAAAKGISEESAAELVMAKFWDSFNSASSMNENTDGLKAAHECIAIMDGLAGNHDELVRIKHLLKAISNLKNFKLVVNGHKITPVEVTSNYSAADSQLGAATPMTLVTLVLDQNPKSYLAFGKLHKILNDLGLFFGHQLDHGFSRLNSACIELALVDNNFAYAYKRSKELFSHYSTTQTADFGEYWLTFYQVGKYALPEWINDVDSISDAQLEVLEKQREILLNALIYCHSTEHGVGNSKLLLRQWELVNDQIDMYYQQLAHAPAASEKTVVDNLLSEAATTTHQTSEKLSKLFASGLGWALGANPP